MLLRNIPHEIQFSCMDKEYSLIGIVNFKHPMVTTRQAEDNNIGHYTAVSLRKNKKWYMYDDCKDGKQLLADSYSTCPHLIIYSL